MHRILIADDHSIVRRGLSLTLQQYLPDYTFDEAWDAETVMDQLKKQAYDLVLLDLNMPDTDPSILMHWVKSFYPDTRILILSMNEETFFGLRSIQLGAKGYLKKNAPSEDIITAVQTVLAGKKYVSPELADIILNNTLDGKQANPFERLSAREFQVAMYLVQDATDEHPVDGLNYYRIQQVDKDGRSSSTGVKSVAVRCNGGDEIKVFPTVSNSSIQVLLPAGYEEATVELLTTLGQKIEVPVEGSNLSYRIRVDQLASAMYIVRIRKGAELHSYKVIKEN